MAKILSIGLYPSDPDITVVSSMENSPSLFDYDIVIVDPSKIKYRDFMLDWNIEWIDHGDERNYVEIQDRIRKESGLLLEKGGLIVCLVTPVIGLQYSYVSTIGEQTKKFTNYDWLPFKQKGKRFSDCLVQGKGTDVIVGNNSSVSQYLKMKEIEWYAYFEGLIDLRLDRTVFEEIKDDANFKIEILGKNRADKPVSFVVNIGNGRIVFLPLSRHDKFTDILVQAAVKLSHKKIEKTAPLWIRNYLIPGEKELQNKLKKYNNDIQELESKKKQLFTQMEKTISIKKLLYEQDNVLEDAVKDAFVELGFSMRKKGDIDWVAEADGKEAVVEVTGTDKPITIDKLRQLLEYVQTEENTDKIPDKAILVGNHFLNKDPKDRGDAFTEKAIKAAAVNSICLIPTTELYGILCQLREQKVSSNEIRDKIFSTSGVCKLG